MAETTDSSQKITSDSISALLMKSRPLSFHSQSVATSIILKFILPALLAVGLIAYFTYWLISASLASQNKQYMQVTAQQSVAHFEQQQNAIESNQIMFRQHFIQYHQSQLTEQTPEQAPKQASPQTLNLTFSNGINKLDKNILVQLAEPKLEPNSNLIRFITTSANFLAQTGPAWSKYSTDLYLFSENNFNLHYWPSLTETNNAKLKSTINNKLAFLSRFSLNQEQNNQANWTTPYFDKNSQQWVMSLLMPLTINQQQLVLAQDIPLTQLLPNQSVVQNNVEQYQFILTAEGYILSHPDYQAINTRSDTESLLNVNKLSNHHSIKNLFFKTQALPAEQKNLLLENEAQHNLVYASRLPLNQWWLMQVYPKSNVQSVAMQAAELIIWLCVFIFIALVVILFCLIRHHITRPFKPFSQLATHIKSGDYQLSHYPEIKLPTERKDEIGLIANLFVDTCSNLQYTLESLEGEITQRTLNLDLALQEQKAIFNNAYIGILLIKNGTVVSCNKRFEEITGYKIEEVMTESKKIISLDGRNLLTDINWIKYKINELGSYMIDCEFEHKNGNHFWCSVQFKALDNQQLDKGIVVTMVDITKRRNAELLLAREARVDGLTGIGNRRAFDEAILLSCRRAQREQTTITLAILDVDLFKKYNDFYGHVAGDEALIKVAKQLAKTTRRPYELAARYGGEEFALIVHGEINVQAQFEKVLNRIQALNIEHQQSPYKQLTVSIGIVSITGDAHQKISTQWLIEKADAMLYQAKKSGRNTIKYQNLSADSQKATTIKELSQSKQGM